MSRLRSVAIVGAGPAGFYAAEALLKPQMAPPLRVDVFDKLPTPFGLVRSGVAPDHQSIKRIARSFSRTAAHPAFRFFGNVEVGRDLSADDLRAHYDAILYATGNEDFLRLDLPGAASPWVRSATEFVFWYNGHPEHQRRGFDLLSAVEHVVIVGVGNVAVDVARILLRAPDVLASTDIAPAALDTLRHSRVRRVTLLGRRGALQAAFSPQELRELADLPGLDIRISLADAVPDPVSQDWLASPHSPPTAPLLADLFAEIARRPDAGAARQLDLRFCLSPLAFHLRPDGALQGVEVAHNRLVPGRERPNPVPTGQTEMIEAQLALTSIGYRGVPLPGVPFDPLHGTLPNVGGRVTGHPREYVVGWARRGPTGLIGANRPDAREVVAHLFQDLPDLPIPPRADAPIAELLRARGVRVVTFADWERIDAEEIRRGQRHGRLREKFTDVAELLRFLDA